MRIDHGQCFADIIELSWRRSWERLHDEGDNVFATLTNGIGLYGRRLNDQRPFGCDNPAIISWGVQTLLPNKDDTVVGASIQLGYDIVFARFVRMIAETLREGDLADEAFRLQRAGLGRLGH